ncbi:DUF5060 domain-containing protein [Maribellus comscasis]|uniref:DUF5060 domain-containing protein n=1 Tax=Maribellus comscasis TaxID=2681766 RepID=A0A6I6JQD4_9BACT|nr:DUF5060 domain-containing protein [Maribellus comscasis]QGY42213.1 DUF5060 domain-containing protein [Maribellus comscasis]
MKFLLYLSAFFLLISCKTKTKSEVEITGELKQWHKITLIVSGPETSEWNRENPFLDYKLDVTFSNGSVSYKVPGFFAADGNAAETSAERGNIWKVCFRPDLTGEWSYKISFRKGKNIVVLEEQNDGESLAADGVHGSFVITESDKSADDFRKKGRIVNGGKGYFRFQDSEEIWIKNGADSPENFLAYADFDQTYRFSLKTETREGEADPKKDLHKYEPHIRDWNEGDPSWQNGKGKGIIGALNYLHAKGVNSVYMLTMNILGDGKDVWPYNDHNERYRFDCSKLDQWEMVFDHMDNLGMMMHFVLQETENEVLLDAGYTDVQRKLYIRELTARFGHHLGITWNIGEENGPAGFSPIGQTDAQKKDMANYLKKINPYPSVVVLHTHSNDAKQDEYLIPMLGFENLDGPSMQIGDPLRVHERILKWVQESEKSGKRWLVNLDEIGQHWKGVMPDSYDLAHDTIRQSCLWGTLLAGGAGVEWYFGYRYPHTDLSCEDFRSREQWWKQSTIATQFVQQFPLEEMVENDALIDVESAYCLAQPGELYIIYLPIGRKTTGVNFQSDGNFKVQWFNPREGGGLKNGSVDKVAGSGFQDLGNPPEDAQKDWVVVVQK